MSNDHVSEKDLIPGYKHLVKNGDYLGGLVAVLGCRITVSQILEELAFGMNVSDIAKSYNISTEAIQEALKYGSQLANHTQAA